jgi:hypothetical protein
MAHFDCVSPFLSTRQSSQRRLGKAIVETVWRQIIVYGLDGDGGRRFDMDRPIRPVEFDDRVLTVLMDLYALCSRAERARAMAETG